MTLTSIGREKITYAFHPNVEVSGRQVKKYLISAARLSEEEAWKLIH